MSRSVQFHALAEAELQEASDYYGRTVPGLREAFLDEVERGYRLLIEFPEIGVLVRQGVRKLVVKRFPYSLFYTVQQETIRIFPTHCSTPFNRRRFASWR